MFSVGVSKYAQYEKVPFVNFVPKGKRREITVRKHYKPMIVVLKGQGHPEPQDLFKPPVRKAEVDVSESMYSSFDDRPLYYQRQRKSSSQLSIHERIFSLLTLQKTIYEY